MVCSIKNLSEYIAVLESQKLYNCISRGEHKKYDTPLCSSILRLSNPECYDELLTDYHSQFEAELSDLQNRHFIAFSQHHGIPTNLLDFSKSPLVSLYFATEKCKKNGYVYFIKNDKLANATRAIINNSFGWGLLKDLFDFKINTLSYLAEPLSNAFEKNDKEMVEFFIGTALSFIENFRNHFLPQNNQGIIDAFDKALHTYITHLEDWNSTYSLCIFSSYREFVNGLLDISREGIISIGDICEFFISSNPLHANSRNIEWFSVELILLLMKYVVMLNYYEDYSIEKGQIELPFYFSYNPPIIDIRVKNQASIFVFQPFTTDHWYSRGRKEKVRYWQTIIPDFEIQIENPILIQEELDAIGINRSFIYCDYDNAAKYTVDRLLGTRSIAKKC